MIAAKILAARDPAEAKRLSFEIKASKESQLKWNAERYDLMSAILTAKFTQNPKLAVELRATGNKRIAESGRHEYYATGLSITHKDVLNPSKWTSQSKLGELLMNVRREINRA